MTDKKPDATDTSKGKVANILMGQDDATADLTDGKLTTDMPRGQATDMTGRERMLRALRGKEVDRVPIWFMRQAGRYLPEYLELRKQHSFDERLKDPAIAAKITLQPMTRFPLDAAVLFSDILVPFEAMGHKAHFRGKGPEIDNPLRNPAAVEALPVPVPEEAFPFVGEAIQQVRAALPDRAVLGFAGSPFTLACYLIDGQGSKGFTQTKRFAYQHPDAWQQLMDKLARTVADHMAYQIRMGADAVQLFDTWAEILGPGEYEALALPSVQQVFRRLRDQNDARAIYFARGTPHLLPFLGETGADAYSIDWRIDLQTVRQHYPNTPLQGNLDPTLLWAPRRIVAKKTQEIVDSLDGEAHVFNLGHGILPGTPMEGVEAMVRTVTES